MTQTKNTTELRKGKYLNFAERLKIEAWKELKQPLSNREIARRLGRYPQAIHTKSHGWSSPSDKTARRTSMNHFVILKTLRKSNMIKHEVSIKRPKWLSTPDFMAYTDYHLYFTTPVFE